MNILFFDTETTGLPKNYKAEISDLDNWPRIVQLGFCFHADEEHFTEYEFIIKPDGWEIPAKAAEIHGITTERALAEGIAIKNALDVLGNWINMADLVVGHNVSFDRKVLGAEFLRAGMPDLLHGKPRLCTMHSTTKFCNLPGKYGPKWPKLEELYQVLFEELPSVSHSALADVKTTAKCFFELIDRNVITPEQIEAAINYKPVEGF